MHSYITVYTVTASVVDRHHVDDDQDSDLDPPFHFDANSDRIWIQVQVLPQVLYVLENYIALS